MKQDVTQLNRLLSEEWKIQTEMASFGLDVGREVPTMHKARKERLDEISAFYPDDVKPSHPE